VRIILTVLAACAVVLAGCVQLASTALFGDLAPAPAFPRIVSPAIGFAIARPLANPHAPALLRAAYARALLHRDDVTGADAIVQALPATAERFELAGAIAQRRGDFSSAAQAYLAARDVEHAQSLVDALERSGRLDAAIALETDLVAHSTGAVDAENHAVTLWRLGQLTQARAVQQPPARARQLSRDALHYYDEALALAPSDETFLLAAGQQAFTLGDRASALTYYQRALDAVPNSVDARRGLERARLP
jgi:tetratricopeptide (TPR) repeat protein